jgi:microcystin-dependent protein
MATITGLTAERMFEIEAATVVGGEIVGDHLILHKQDGSTVDTGPFPPGPIGPAGPAGGMIPGEVKLWSGTVLPAVVDYGKWVWADGATYDVATYPKAAANISPQWRTFAGASDPPAALFRVPDLRGLVPAGLDQMPGGARANRVTRSVAIVVASKTGEEIHVITTPEMPTHSHGIYDPGHVHTDKQFVNLGSGTTYVGTVRLGTSPLPAVTMLNPATTGIVVQNAGSNNAHENMQPTVFVPYIVKLD